MQEIVFLVPPLRRKGRALPDRPGRRHARRPGPQVGPVTFVLTESRLVTVRYHQPRSIGVFAARAATQAMVTDGPTVLLALIKTIVDRLADILEGEARKLDLLSKAIFDAHRPNGRAQTLPALLQRIGRAEDLNSKVEGAEHAATHRRLPDHARPPAPPSAR